MDNINKLAKDILEEALIMSIGTLDDGGVWVSDVVFVNDDSLNIYWISTPECRHSKAIEMNPKVSCTITASFEPNNEQALQIEGTAKLLGGEHIELEEKHYKKRGKPYLNSTSKRIPKNYVWFQLVPTKMELHYSQKFGYNKQNVTVGR